MEVKDDGTSIRVLGIRQLNATNYEAVRDEIRKWIALGTRKDLEIDLSQITYIDSCGLGALINLYKYQERRGYNVRLINPSMWVNEMLVLTRLSQIFDIVREEERQT